MFSGISLGLIKTMMGWFCLFLIVGFVFVGLCIVGCLGGSDPGLVVFC